MSTKYKNKAQTNGKQRKAQGPQKVAQFAPQPAVVEPVTAEREARKEAQRVARMERQVAAQEAARKRKRMAAIRRNGIIAGAVIVLAAVIALYYINEAGKPGQLIDQMASPHLAGIDSPHVPYTTDPPTSGPHVKEVPNWGVHTEPIRRELAIHGLEDGGVIVNYQPELDKATIDRLAALVESYPDEVILAPYEPDQLSHPIVVTAWQRIDRMDAFDEARLKRFIDAYRGIDHHADSGT